MTTDTLYTLKSGYQMGHLCTFSQPYLCYLAPLITIIFTKLADIPPGQLVPTLLLGNALPPQKIPKYFVKYSTNKKSYEVHMNFKSVNTQLNDTIYHYYVAKYVI